MEIVSALFIEDVQMRLFGAVDDGIFKEVALLASDLNSLRRVLLGCSQQLLGAIDAGGEARRVQ